MNVAAPKSSSKVADTNNNDTCVAVDNVNSAKKLDDLNDDCLLRIFESLDTIDLFRLIKVRSRFRSIIARKIISKRSIDIAKFRRNHSVRKVLRMFGKYANGLNISSADVQYHQERRTTTEEMFHLVAKHSDNLRKLVLSGDFSATHAQYADALAGKLTKLQHLSVQSMRNWLRPSAMADVANECVHRVLTHAKRIESIELMNMPFTGDLLCDNQFDVLKKLAIINCASIDGDTFDHMMHRIGHQLETFEWKNSTFQNESTIICQTIADACEVIGKYAPNLKSLAIEMNYGRNYCQKSVAKQSSVFDKLLTLKHLVTLKIGCAGACSCANIAGFVAKLTRIIDLTIESPLQYNNVPCRTSSKEVNESLGIHIAKLSQLKALRLVHVCKEEQNLLESIAQIPEMQEIHLNGYRVMHQQKLLDLVERGKHLTVLNFHGTKFKFTVDLFEEISDIIQKRNAGPLTIYLDAAMYESVMTALTDDSSYDNRFVRLLVASE